jgi:hypothetical protein
MLASLEAVSLVQFFAENIKAAECVSERQQFFCNSVVGITVFELGFPYEEDNFSLTNFLRQFYLIRLSEIAAA